MKMNKTDLGRLLLAVALCQAAGIFGSVFTASSIPTWYATLQKPSFSPPNWIFGPVWVTLYTLMGLSLFLVWKRSAGNREVRTSMKIFGAHLLLNALWSFLFFGLRSPAAGFLGITAVLATLLVVVTRFRRVSRNAALILLPYVAWVSFATILNLSIWLLNP
jgi:tryptophan-rich sensory protein